MKHRNIIIIITLITLLAGGVLGCAKTIDEPDNEITVDNSEKSENNQEIDEPEGKTLKTFQETEQPMVLLDELAAAFAMEWNYDVNGGSLNILFGGSTYKLLRNTSIISKDGVYLPNKTAPDFSFKEEIYFPLSMLQFFDLTYKTAEQVGAIEVFTSDDNSSATQPVLAQFEQEFATMDEEAIAAYLSVLSVPLEGARLTTRDSQLPGAPRDYRNGTHEGLDWYEGYTGIAIDRSTEVLSMADGIVVRADHDYVELSFSERDEILGIAALAEDTPEYILDKLRGRTVWVQYPNGILVRYAHLTSVAPGVEVGKELKRGEVLGYVGNSGTSYGVEGNDLGLHLHSDILIYDHLFWENLDMNQIRVVLEKLFP